MKIRGPGEVEPCKLGRNQKKEFQEGEAEVPFGLNCCVGSREREKEERTPERCYVAGCMLGLPRGCKLHVDVLPKIIDLQSLFLIDECRAHDVLVTIVFFS